jgi:hypothetical protein
MSDDLNKKVQQIAQMLGQDDVPDNVKELIATIATSLKGDSSSNGDSSPKGDSPSKGDSPQPQRLPDQDGQDAENAPNTAALSNETLDSAKKVLRQINSVNDPRINLLNAIKPFMNNKRQKKIGNCIQLLQIASLSRMLNEKEK